MSWLKDACLCQLLIIFRCIIVVVSGTTYAWLYSPEPFIVAETSLVSKGGRAPSFHLADVGEGFKGLWVAVRVDFVRVRKLGVISPTRHVPVLLWNNLEDTSSIGSVGSELLEPLWKILDAKENPVVQVAVVELVLNLLNTEESGTDIIFLDEGHQGCFEGGISRRGQG